VDTVGELSSLYSLADVAFVGGSLVKKGGHNILEPAVAAVPVLFGPHMANFAKMAEDFLEHGAAMRVRDARELASAAVALFENPDRAKEIGECGRALVARSAGATARTVEKIVKLL
jgi:3-deoxy-D-manno-octulosonic-acid transferase